MYEIICTWLALTPIFVVIAIVGAIRKGSVDAFFSTLFKLYGFSLYATLLAMGLIIPLMIPYIAIVVVVGEVTNEMPQWGIEGAVYCTIAIVIGCHIWLARSLLQAESEPTD